MSSLVGVFPARLLFSGINMEPWWGSCTRFLHYDDNMRLWLTQPPLACETQSDELCSTCPSFPVAKTDRMSLLSVHSCHKSQHAWHAWYTGRSGQQIAWSVGSEGARQSDGVLPGHRQFGSRPQSGMIWSPTSVCWPHLRVSNVPTSAQKHESASNMGSNRETSTGSMPSFQMLCHRMLGSVSPRCAPLLQLCPSLSTRDGARCSLS